MMTPSYVSWPPPGLERLQGASSPLVRALGIGGVLLSFPLLWSIGTDAPYWEFGPFGKNWWAVPLLAGIGLVFVLVGLGRLFVMLRAAYLNMKTGHGLLTVAQVAADTNRDTGFLIQGARHYAGMEEEERESLMFLRLSRAGLFVAGVLWLLLGLLVSVLLAARGRLSPVGMWSLTFTPAVVLLLAGLYCRVREMLIVHGARAAAREAAEEDLADQMAGWRSAYAGLGAAGLLARGPIGTRRPFSWSAVVLGVFSVLFFVAMSGIIVVSAGGPLAASVSIPRFQGVQAKAAIAEVMRPWRLPPDPSITARQAGESLNVFLRSYGSEGGYTRPPVRTYPEWWDRRMSNTRVRAMFPDAARGRFSRADRTYLEEYADLPPAAEFGIMGRAAEADFTGGMLMTPLPDTLTVYGMFVPRFQSLTDGARCQVATAVLQLADGDRAGAENTLREVLSTGLLMLDDGTHLITNLIGIVVVGVAAEALEDFYAATGDQRSADRIHELREGAEHAAGTGGTRGPIDTESAVREMARMARDPGMMRGLRWEFVAIVSHLAPCMNLHGAIHGPGTDYRGWLEATRTSLVRYPAEESLFDVYARSSEAGAMTGEEDDFLWKLFGAAQRLLGIRGGCAL